LQSIQRAVKGGYKVGNYYFSLKLSEIFTGSQKISLKKKTIYVYDLEGKYITSLNSAKEICEFFNIKSISSITTAIRTRRQYRDFQISLEYKDNLGKIIDKRNIKKPIEQYSLTGDLIRTFDSMTEAKKEYGSGVQKVLKGQQQQCKNFIFKYKS
jgi:DNA-binding XRE family transcriptional regulator